MDDPIKEFLDPAIKGTVGLLKSANANAPGVKRVVITSSSAAMLNFEDHAKVYDETHWAPLTWDDAMDPEKTYRASKVSHLMSCHVMQYLPFYEDDHRDNSSSY